MSAVSPTIQPSKPPIWNDPVYRGIFFQFVLLACVVLLGYYIFNNVATNLQRQNIASGFGFLETTAGFGIIMHLVEYTEESSYGRAFLVGLLNTIIMSVIGIALATVLGVIIGVARLSTNWLIAKLAMVYIEIVRNIPLLLQIFFWYFAVLRTVGSPRDLYERGESVAFGVNNRGLYLPAPEFEPAFRWVWIVLVIAIVALIIIRIWAKRRQAQTGQQFPLFWTALGLLLGLPFLVFLITGLPVNFSYAVMGGFKLSGGLVIIPEFVALLLALAIYTAAFIAEIVRAGIQAVNYGQTEAARSLGLKGGPTLRLVILPQALRVIIPPLTSQYLNLTKNSSLAVAIAYPDLVSVFAGTVLNQTGQAVEILLLTMAVYLTLSLLISLFMNWYNKKMALVER